MCYAHLGKGLFYESPLNTFGYVVKVERGQNGVLAKIYKFTERKAPI